MIDEIRIPAERVCPRCEQTDVVPVVFGLPSPETFELAERGFVALGGCLLDPEPADFVCRSCGHAWGDVERPRQ